ncbi:hypothetical protein D1632_14090 [Chryseobacterium nematophagum]|uniref:Uncharacterized protein n=1 Tax=Chryseobacterium nematophagum TaxID=2305228 RepID=A0A3M7LB85_9FLAO|nr:hypothetical protein [Chryseobacterium nematophagum]RMZ58716.1 hypothetical protein D1632_14090 [Chryseobacterium nematophagum]
MKSYSELKVYPINWETSKKSIVKDWIVRYGTIRIYTHGNKDIIYGPNREHISTSERFNKILMKKVLPEKITEKKCSKNRIDVL